jgi:hypothetical protein
LLICTVSNSPGGGGGGTGEKVEGR